MRCILTSYENLQPLSIRDLVFNFKLGSGHLGEQVFQVFDLWDRCAYDGVGSDSGLRVANGHMGAVAK